MALIDEFRLAIENDTQFRQRLSLAVTKVVVNVLSGTAPAPTPDQKALGKRFFLNPDAEVDRYLLPVAAKMAINGAAFTDDAALTTACQQIMSLNVALLIA